VPVSSGRSKHPFSGLSSRTTQISRYKKEKTILDFNKESNHGILGWQLHQWTIFNLHLAQDAPDRPSCPTPHDSIFTGQMLLLTPNEQYQSTEGDHLS